MEDCSDKVVVVTGSAGGIGSALSEAFAQIKEASGLHGRSSEKSAAGLGRAASKRRVTQPEEVAELALFYAASGPTTLPALILPSTMA